MDTTSPPPSPPPSSFTLEVGGVRLAFDRYGTEKSPQPPMVLLHAAGQDASAWSEVAPALAARRSVYALDLRGHGRSDWPGKYSFELMRDDVLKFVNVLGLTDVTLVGHSLGGTIAWLVAEQRPDWLARLVAEDSVPPAPGDELRLRPRGEAAPPPTRDPQITAAIVEHFNNPDPRWWSDIATVSVPVLAGGPTSHVPQRRIAEAAATVPDGRLVEIPAGHHIHRDRPAEFIAALEKFTAGR